MASVSGSQNKSNHFHIQYTEHFSLKVHTHINQILKFSIIPVSENKTKSPTGIVKQLVTFLPLMSLKKVK